MERFQRPQRAFVAELERGRERFLRLGQTSRAAVGLADSSLHKPTLGPVRRAPELGLQLLDALVRVPSEVRYHLAPSRHIRVIRMQRSEPREEHLRLVQPPTLERRGREPPQRGRLLGLDADLGQRHQGIVRRLVGALEQGLSRDRHALVGHHSPRRRQRPRGPDPIVGGLCQHARGPQVELVRLAWRPLLEPLCGFEDDLRQRLGDRAHRQRAGQASQHRFEPSTQSSELASVKTPLREPTQQILVRRCSGELSAQLLEHG